MRDMAAKRRSVTTLGKTATLALMGACLGVGLMGCAEDKPSVRPATAVRSRPAQQGAVETPTVENAEERAEEIRKVCNRKASTELPRCWSEEFDRTKNRKFSAQIDVMLTISPDGRAQDVEVLSPKPERKEIEKCVSDLARGWSFPSGQTVSPVQCSFFLQSSS